MKNGTGSTDRGGYRIGTVVHLTGIDAHTIRAWERRYNAIRPARTEGGTRLYRDEEVARLQLLRALVDCGEAVGGIARLDDAQLRERLARLSGLSEAPASSSTDPAAVPRPVRLAVLHRTLPGQLRLGAAARAGLELVLADADLDAFVARLADAAPEALVLGLDVLGRDPLAALRRIGESCDARLVVVVYEFARRKLLGQLARQGVKLLRGPASSVQIEQTVCDADAAARARERRGLHLVPAPSAPEPAPDAGAAARRFSDAQLAQLRELRTSVDCECPNHLASLVESLLAFESYSRDCESRDAQDAALHRRLAEGTGRARATIEELLVVLCAQDGIRL